MSQQLFKTYNLKHIVFKIRQKIYRGTILLMNQSVPQNDKQDNIRFSLGHLIATETQTQCEAIHQLSCETVTTTYYRIPRMVRKSLRSSFRCASGLKRQFARRSDCKPSRDLEFPRFKFPLSWKDLRSDRCIIRLTINITKL